MNTVHKRGGRRGPQPQPTWAKDVEKTLIDLGMKKIDLARLLNVNVSHMNGCITGSRVSPVMEKLIIAKVEELKAGA